MAEKEYIERISIHTLRVEGDGRRLLQDISELAFQSTPSVWRVTKTDGTTHIYGNDFNPHPPCGG